MPRHATRALILWMTAAVACSALLVPSAPVRGQDAKPPRDLAPLLETIREEHGVPALGGAVVGSEGLAALGVSGVRVEGGSVAVTNGDLWHIGSDTKAMTATLVARLHERGKLTFDASMADVFGRRKMHADWRPVTVLQLLGNRGGAPGDISKLPLWGRLWGHTGTPTEARRMLLEDLVSRAPETAPGEAYVYSNASFALAGHAAERAAGKAYEELMQREVFAPLGITSASFGAPGKSTDPKAPDQPWGHVDSAVARAPMPPGPRADNPPGIAPAGGVHLSLSDWARFAGAQLRGARGAPSEFLTAETFRVLHTPLDGQPYALGWIVATQPWGEGGKSIPVLTHDGSNTMWYATVWIAPDRDQAFLAVCNAAGKSGRDACHAVIRGLVSAPPR